MTVRAGFARLPAASAAKDYLIATALACAAVGLRLVLDRYLTGVQFITFFPAVIISAYFCGRAGGLLTAVLCGLAGWYWLVAPVGSFEITRAADAFTLLLFAGVSAAIALSVGAVRETVSALRSSQAALRESEERLRFLDRLGRETAKLTDADAILAETTRMVGEHLDLAVCAYADMDEDEDGFTIRGDWSAPGSPSIVGHYSLADFGKLAVQKLSAGEPLVVNDNLRELAPEEAATFQSIGIAATICMPLVKAERLTALMAIHDKVPRPWSSAELALIGEVTERSWAHVERVGALADLRAGEALTKRVFDNLQSGLVIGEVVRDETGKAVDWRYVEANPAWAELVGVPREAALGRRIREVFPAMEAEWVNDFTRVVETGEPIRFTRQVGFLERWYEGHAFRIEPERFAVSFLDVTDRRRAESAAQEVHARLTREFEERTAELELAQEQLRQSQKMEAIGHLTGGIAHDFNNMLAVVIGSLDLLGRRLDGEDARTRRYVDSAMDGARRAALITQRLLAFSRQQPLRPEPIDANKLVAGISDLLRHSLGADVRLETVLAGGLWRTSADANQLENVLLNLAVNARDAMPGGGRLTIETQNAHLDERYAAQHLGVPAGQYVLIAVSDTGTGMPEEVIAKAFDPFFTTKDVGKGTGLGLSQVYGFVKQSGGHVKIYSEPGQGTTVKVYLPRLAGAAGEEAVEISPAELASGVGQEVVLVVEDEEAVRQITAEALSELGYRVLEADGAATALPLLDAHPEVGLLFTDVVMPDVNGRQLADEARRRRPDLKVLFTTGYTRNAVVHNGVLDPGVELIGKPFTVEELAAKVRSILDSAAEQADAAG